jgi:hypothetical protein
MSIHTARLASVLLLVLTPLAACGDDEASSSSGTGGGTTTGGGAGGAADAPPEISGPAAIVAPEGRTVSTPVTATDPDGGPVTVSATVPAGLDAEVVAGEADFTLRLHAAYDAVDGAAVLAATDEAGATSDVEIAVDVIPIAWTDVVEWTDDGPEAREHASVLVDDASGSIYVMFGSGYAPYLEPLGDAWRFDVATRTWSEATLEGDVPPPGGSRRFAGQRGSGHGWLHGGYGEGNVSFGELYSVVADGDVLTFQEVPQENGPGPRVLHVFGFDPGTETFALHGGVGGSSLRGDTWSMKIVDGVAVWTLVHGGTLAGAPQARYGAFSGVDEEAGRMVLFSGQTSQTAFGQDTWILDLRAEAGPTWTEVTPADGSGPPGRRNGTSVWDPSGPRLFVFGGTSDGATSQPGLFAFDARAGHEGWAEIERDGRPPMRSSGFGAFVTPGEDQQGIDSAVWMGFGNDDDTYRDLARLAY